MSEKRVRVAITGDASGLGKEFTRVQADAKKAFKDLGLDGVLENADKDFRKIQDRLRAIGEALKANKREATTDFKERASKATNDFSRKRVEEDKTDFAKRQEEAWQKWTKLADYLKEQIKNKKIDAEGNFINPDNPEEEPGKKEKLTLGQRVALRSIAGGRMNLSGGVQEAVAGEGGIAESAGLGTGGVLIAGAIVAAVGVALKFALTKGMEEYRTENKALAKFDFDRDSFGTGQQDFGLSNNDFKQYILEQAKSRTSASNIEQISSQRLGLKYGYGLEDNEIQSFDRFRQQDKRGTESGRLIVDILSRSEKNGLLGVSGGDFTLLPQKIEQVANLMSLQKANGETVDSNTAIGLMMAGTKIGGRFGDDRAGEAFGRIDQNIKNPGNPGMKAFVFEQLRRANPGGSYTDIMADMENGASAHNLEAILPSIARMPKGEMRRMVLKQFTGNYQDARRLDGSGNINEMLRSLKENPLSDTEAEKRFGAVAERGKDKVDFMKSIGAEISSGFSAFGKEFIKPIDDAMKGKAVGPSVYDVGVPGSVSGAIWMTGMMMKSNGVKKGNSKK